MKKFLYLFLSCFAAIFYNGCTKLANVKFAVSQNPLTGRMKNKFANAIFSTVYGQNIVRSKPISVRPNNSQARIDQRNWFKDAQELTSGTIYTSRLGAEWVSTKRSPFASSMSMKMASPSISHGTVKVVDIANIRVSDGNIPQPELTSITRTSQFVVTAVIDKPLRPDGVAYTGTYYAIAYQRKATNLTGAFCAEASVAIGSGSTTSLVVNLPPDVTVSAVDVFIFFVATNGGIKNEALSADVYNSVV